MSDHDESDQYVPEGYYVQTDADGERYVRKQESKSPHSDRIDELLASLPPHNVCPKCGGSMIHERLRGYQCFRGCQP